jgi:hypothetical protein
MAVALTKSELLDLALEGPFPQISNADPPPQEVDNSILGFIKTQGKVKDGEVTWPIVIAMHQTGTNGPQDGTRLVLVKAGFKVDSQEGINAIEHIRRTIPAGAAEYTVLK